MTQISLPPPAVSHLLRCTGCVGPHCCRQGIQLHTCICVSSWLILSWKKALVGVSQYLEPWKPFPAKMVGERSHSIPWAGHSLHLPNRTNVNNNIHRKCNQGLLQEWKKNLLLGLRGTVLEIINYGHKQGRIFKHKCYGIHQVPAREFQINIHERWLMTVSSWGKTTDSPCHSKLVFLQCPNQRMDPHHYCLTKPKLFVALCPGNKVQSLHRDC